jgi:hypothetical protein
MPILRELQEDILQATGQASLEVSLWSRSSSNIVVLLRGPDGEAFFAKVFAYDTPGGMKAGDRYNREKTILAAMSGQGAPEMVYHADVERVIVTRGVVGHGVKHFIDNGNGLIALASMAQWLARFHNRFDERGTVDRTVFQHIKQYPRFASLDGFDELSNAMKAIPVSELVMSRGDGSASNFRFTEERVVGLDFEGAAYRAQEVDMISIAQDFHLLTDKSAQSIAECVVAHYALIRPIANVEATVELIAGFLPMLSAAQEAA